MSAAIGRRVLAAAALLHRALSSVAAFCRRCCRRASSVLARASAFVWWCAVDVAYPAAARAVEAARLRLASAGRFCIEVVLPTLVWFTVQSVVVCGIALDTVVRGWRRMRDLAVGVAATAAGYVSALLARVATLAQWALLRVWQASSAVWRRVAAVTMRVWWLACATAVAVWGAVAAVVAWACRLVSAAARAAHAPVVTAWRWSCAVMAVSLYRSRQVRHLLPRWSVRHVLALLPSPQGSMRSYVVLCVAGAILRGLMLTR